MVIQNVTSTVFRVVGRAVLQSGGLGGGDSSNRRVSVVLPTFGPIDDDDDYDEDEDDTENLDVRADDNNAPSGNLLSVRFGEDNTSTTAANDVESTTAPVTTDKSLDNEVDSTSVKTALFTVRF